MGRKKIEIVKGFKAVNKELEATGGDTPFKYKIGKEYKEDEAKLCSRGFHFCENPLDTLNYYDLCDSRFFEIEAKDVSDERNENDTKRVAKRIKLTAEIGLPKLINLSFEYIKKQCEVEGVNSGNYSQVATSGNYSQVATSGNYSQVATSGDHSQVATSGNYSQVATSGDSSKVAVDGKHSVGMCAGINSKIKGKVGNWITLAEWKYNSGEYIPVCVKSAQIDGKRLKEDTYYKLEDGEFKEC